MTAVSLPNAPAFTPIVVLDFDLTEPLPTLSVRPDGAHTARALVRVHGQPIATLDLSLPLGAHDLAREVWARCGAELHAVGVTFTDGRFDTRGAAALNEHRARRAAALHDAPLFSVVVCTRNRPQALAVCLAQLRRLKYPNFEVVVVDNAPNTDATERIVLETAREDGRVRLVTERRPGLSNARNTGLRESRGHYVAFIDDDERPDPHWLAEAWLAFRQDASVSAVSGPVLPSELETPAQVWFEQFGGHMKARGFRRWRFDVREANAQPPLFPVPPFGVGANMIFRADALRAIGGFDPALGAGTASQASEDTAAFFWMLVARHAVLFVPGMITWHEHRRDFASLEKQLYSYGVGLTAFYTHCLFRRPILLIAMLALLPRALRYITSTQGLRTETRQSDYPASLDRAQRLGLLRGPFAYLTARRHVRRTVRS